MIFFSATYPDHVEEEMAKLIKDAQKVVIKKKEALSLDHIQQYMYKCDKGKKPDFISDIFAAIQVTQTIIFVNTANFAQTLRTIMKKKGLKVHIIFGG